MFELIARVQDFLETGGDVLLLIMGVTFFMWLLIIERVWYFRWQHPRERGRVLSTWQERSDQNSWHAYQIRRLIISQVQIQLEQGLPLIRTLVAICPLLGLLGTVTGMIEVFDVMAVAGNGNARAMASGVSKATIPTMAGMVAALSGMVISVQMDRYAREEGERIADHLTHV